MENFFQQEKIYTVLELNNVVRGILRQEFPGCVWVCGEIQDLRARQHINFNLVQKHAAADEIIAQAKAVIFENNKKMIFTRLAQSGADIDLKDDISVKLLCKVDFYPKNGQFSLTVFDIDPVYTLGKVAQARLKTIEELRLAGLLEKNKLLSMPVLPLNIGLITSFGSAAYHDFINELGLSGMSFKVFVFDCLMQGKAVEAEVSSAISHFNDYSPGALDVIVITRGGGAAADLAWFDNKNIATAIALCRFPVICALGHQINTTIADLAAHTSVKTPTASAQFLTSIAAGFRDNLNALGSQILKSAADLTARGKDSLEDLTVRIDSSLPRFFLRHHNELLEKKMSLLSVTGMDFKVKMELAGHNYRLLLERVNKIFKNYLNRVKYVEEKISLLNPRNILKRGYSVTYKAGKAVKSIGGITAGDTINTVVYDGSFISLVGKKNNEQENGKV